MFIYLYGYIKLFIIIINNTGALTMTPITSPEDLGRALKMHRKKLGLTQIETGKKFNLTQKTVSNIENGRPGVQLETLFRLMSALNLEMHMELRDAPYKGEVPW